MTFCVLSGSIANSGDRKLVKPAPRSKRTNLDRRSAYRWMFRLLLQRRRQRDDVVTSLDNDDPLEERFHQHTISDTLSLRPISEAKAMGERIDGKGLNIFR